MYILVNIYSWREFLLDGCNIKKLKSWKVCKGKCQRQKRNKQTKQNKPNKTATTQMTFTLSRLISA